MYATVSDVRSLAPHVPINASSQPSEGTVQTWLADFERVIDALFASMGYTVPLTGTVGRTIAKDIITHAVMARVMRSRPNPETDPKLFQDYVDLQLKRLRDPRDTFDLFGETKSGDSVLKESPVRFSSNLRDLMLEEDRPRINRDQIF
jgi:hypothetical protein